MVWLETPTNPTLKIIDIEQVSRISKAKNQDIIVVVDNTFASSYYQASKYVLENYIDIIILSFLILMQINTSNRIHYNGVLIS